MVRERRCCCSLLAARARCGGWGWGGNNQSHVMVGVMCVVCGSHARAPRRGAGTARARGGWHTTTHHTHNLTTHNTQAMAAPAGDAAAGDSSGALKFVAGLLLGALGTLLLKSSGQQQQQPQRKGKPVTRPPAVLQPREELKMVLCVNTSLGMGKGKIGAQCAHAAVGVLGHFRPGNEALFRAWERCGQPKITLKVKDEHEMAELAHRALQSGLPAYIVHDAGRTQIAAGSQTVLAIGPGLKSAVDRVTSHLSLL